MPDTSAPWMDKHKQKFRQMDGKLLAQKIRKLRKRAVRALEMLRAAESVQLEKDRH